MNFGTLPIPSLASVRTPALIIAALFVFAGFAIAVGGALYLDLWAPVYLDSDSDGLLWAGGGALVAAPGLLIALAVAACSRRLRWQLMGNIVIVLYWLVWPATAALREWLYEGDRVLMLPSLYYHSINWAYWLAKLLAPPAARFAATALLGSYVSTGIWWALVTRRPPTLP